jgi:hypothetical protein
MMAAAIADVASRFTGFPFLRVDVREVASDSCAYRYFWCVCE